MLVGFITFKVYHYLSRACHGKAKRLNLPSKQFGLWLIKNQPLQSNLWTIFHKNSQDNKFFLSNWKYMYGYWYVNWTILTEEVIHLVWLELSDLLVLELLEIHIQHHKVVPTSWWKQCDIVAIYTCTSGQEKKIVTLFFFKIGVVTRPLCFSFFDIFPDISDLGGFLSFPAKSP